MAGRFAVAEMSETDSIKHGRGDTGGDEGCYGMTMMALISHGDQSTTNLFIALAMH